MTAEARKLIHDDNRVVLVVAPEKKEAPVPTEAALRAAMAKAEKVPVEAYTDALAGRDLVEKPPAPGKVTARRTVAGSRRDGADAVERRRGVAEADRFQERPGVDQRLRARAARRWRRRRTITKRAWRRRWSASAASAVSTRSI